MRKKATLKDVAQTAGVSPITVSRFVNTPDLVSPSARDKIIRAIEQTGYIPNAAARQLKTSQSDIVFFVVPNIRNELYSVLSHELMLELAQYNKALFICDYNFQDQLEQMLMQEIYKHRPAAIIMAAGDGMSEAQLQLLNTSQIPVIQFDRINEKIISLLKIDIDNFMGGQLAARQLIQQQIKQAVVFTGKTKRVFNERLDGFCSEAEKVNLPYRIVELDFGSRQVMDMNALDNNGDTGYFLLNSDITNLFLQQNIRKITPKIASRMITFDPITNGHFLPFSLSSIAYDRSIFVKEIIMALDSLFADGMPMVSRQVTIPVELA